MGIVSRLKRATATLVVAAIALTVTSCDDAADSFDGSIAFQVVLEAGQRWTAAGAAVESGAMCARGMRHVIRGIDPATSETLFVRAWSAILDAAITNQNSTEVTFVVENTCADGSGSFVTNEQWGPDVWSIVSGTGAYQDLRGAGVMSFVTADYTQIRPLDLRLDGVLEG